MLGAAGVALRRSVRLNSSLRRPFSTTRFVQRILPPSTTQRAGASTAHFSSTAGGDEAPNIRNVAVIAHVDHGKTTLMDMLIKATDPTSKAGEAEDRVMDNMALEQERGITIVSKASFVCYWRVLGAARFCLVLQDGVDFSLLRSLSVCVDSVNDDRCVPHFDRCFPVHTVRSGNFHGLQRNQDQHLSLIHI